MTCYYLAVFWVEVQTFHSFTGEISQGRAMESVFTDSVFLIPFVWCAVNCGIFGLVFVETGLEDPYKLFTGHEFLEHFYCFKIRGIMSRSHVDVVFHGLYDLFGEFDRAVFL